MKSFHSDPAVVRNDRTGSQVLTWDGMVKSGATGQQAPAKTGKYDFSLQLFPISPLPGLTLDPGAKKNLALPVRVINHEDGEFFAPARNHMALNRAEVDSWYQRFANKQNGRLGSAGEGWSWHHIIERDMWQTIPMDEINATKRMIRMRNVDHQRITVIFNAKDTRYHPNTNMSLRAWLKSAQNPNRSNVASMDALGRLILSNEVPWNLNDEEKLR